MCQKLVIDFGAVVAVQWCRSDRKEVNKARTMGLQERDPAFAVWEQVNKDGTVRRGGERRRGGQALPIVFWGFVY